MKKAVIYARYSSDNQSENSIEDQFRTVEERAAREGWTIVEKYADYAISGSSVIRRPEIQRLMQDSLKGGFEIVLSEALDRISRDQEDIARLFKSLKFNDIQLITLSEGEINEMHIGMKGTMNALFLKDLADKVRRGQKGRALVGQPGGGLSYGYRVVRRFDEKGKPVTGERTIALGEAEVIRRVFREYASGKSPQAIAKDLNRDGIPSPGKGSWGPSTIYGNRKRGTGIINNELYMGTLVWNRQRFVKDPSTGKRITRVNNEADLVRAEVPHLRIVEQDLWDKVKKVQGELNIQENSFWAKRRPKTLFSGLLKCGCCGGGFHKGNGESYSCFSAYEKGTCDNKGRIKVAQLEDSVLNALEKHLLDPALCKVFCDEYTKTMNELRKHHLTQHARYEVELAKRMKDDDRMIQMVIDGFASSGSMKEKVATNLVRIEELRGLLENKPQLPPLLLPNMGKHYQEKVSKLITLFRNPEHHGEVVLTIRGLVEKIVLTPTGNGQELSADLHGDLAGILSLASGKAKASEDVETMADQILMVSGMHQTGGTGKMVAGRGFEPLTFRL